MTTSPDLSFAAPAGTPARRLRTFGSALAVGLSALCAQAQPFDGVPGRERESARGHGYGHGPGHGPGPGYGRGPDHHRGGPGYYGPQPGPHHGGPPPGWQGHRAKPRHHHHPGPPPHAQAHGRRHGAGPHHDWYRGGRVPPMYRSHHYVVQDWRMHHLAPPPHGYHWVQNGPDYLLISLGSGVIAQIVFR